MLNNRLVRDFKLYLKRISESSVSATSYSNVTTIFFYEWSTMSNGAKVYYDSEEFLRFCKDSNIVIDAEDVRTLKYARCIYCTCIPNKSTLITAYTHYALSNLLKNYESKAEAETTPS